MVRSALAALLLGAGPAKAAEPQALVVVLIVNGQPQGERFVVRNADGSFLIAPDEALAVTQLARGLRTQLVDGERYVRLDDLPGARLSFDPPSLTLNMTLPPEAFAERAYSLRPGRRPPATTAAGTSALFNYRLGYSAAAEGQPQINLATEQVVRADRWLLRNQELFQHEAGRTQAVRYETQLIRDDPVTLQRLTLGDMFTRSGELGRSVPIGGVGWSRAFELSPYFVRQPSVSFSGAVELPSDVELFVGGNRVFERNVDPGPFEITDLDYYGGLQDVVVVIRDALGRERIIDYAFYFSDQVLARGLHDFSYHIGLLRERFGLRSAQYGEAAWSSYHRYGLTDQLTVGFQGEGTRDYGNLGPALLYRDNRLGVLSVAASASWSESGETDAAYTANYSYNAGRFLANAGWRRYARDYTVLHTENAPEPPLRDLALSLSYSVPVAGSFTLGYSARAYDQAERRVLSLAYSRRLFHNLSLLLGYRHVRADGEDLLGRGGSEWSASLFYLPGNGRSAGSAWQRDARGTQSGSLQFGSAPPGSVGPSYRFSANRRRDAEGVTDTAMPSFQYNGRYGLVGAEAIAVSGLAAATRYAASLAGSAAMVGGYVMLSRPITDSFAVARIEPPLPDVRVYQSNREVGRTNAKGFVLVPDLASYVDNQIAIEPEDIPIEYSIDQASQTLTPAARAGALLDFHVDRLQAVIGSVRYTKDGKPAPLAYRWVQLDDGRRFLTGRDGAFYVENLPAGAYRGSVQLPAGECRVLLEVPDRPEALIEMGDAVSCEPVVLHDLIRAMRMSTRMSAGAH